MTLQGYFVLSVSANCVLAPVRLKPGVAITFCKIFTRLPLEILPMDTTNHAHETLGLTRPTSAIASMVPREITTLSPYALRHLCQKMAWVVCDENDPWE